MLLLRRCAPILALLASLPALLLALALPASAHVRESTGYSSITAEGSEVRYTLSLEYELLARLVQLGPGAVEAADDGARQRALDEGRAALGDYLGERVTVALDGAMCTPELANAAPAERDGMAYAQLELEFACPGDSGEYRVGYDVFSERDAIVDAHTNLVEYRLGGHEGRAVMDAETREFTAGEGSPLASSVRFAGMGVEHLLTGLDHVLFVVALLIGAGSLRKLVGVLSMFTLAHSLTLAAALLGWVHVPAEIVEPLIALSIAYVGAENLLGAKGRMPVVFLFGLLHGLGFAGTLQVTDRVDGSLMLSLLSFNVGIEAGQLLLVAVGLPLILLARRSRFSEPVLRGATIAVAASGLFWFIERFFLA
ncbi:HupE/UreJ family protein [Sinomonas halotolerans]|uniref:HupE/UreJ family protein n=1 Tax=Sinomonas halotolerans TaxID=1644133 RepID=A0ABU9X0H8_9MICC